MVEFNRSEKMIAEKTVCLMLLQGTGQDGQKVYAYLAVRADKLDVMMKAQKQPGFRPEDYGIIIESGQGEPSAEVQERMTREYGFNHEQMVFLNTDNPSE